MAKVTSSLLGMVPGLGWWRQLGPATQPLHVAIWASPQPGGLRSSWISCTVAGFLQSMHFNSAIGSGKVFL